MRARYVQRLIIAMGEEVGEFAAQLQEFVRPCEFDVAVGPGVRKSLQSGVLIFSSTAMRSAKSTGRRLSGSTSEQSENSVP